MTSSQAQKGGGKATISFIVPMFNEAQVIARCLTAILAEASAEDEVLVLDNGSTDASAQIASSFAEVRLVSLPRMTIAALRNHGARLARGSILAFVDADCLLCPGWRSRVVEVLSRGEIAATGSRYRLPENPCWIEKAWFARRSRPPRPVRYINSGNLAVRRSDFQAVRGFDESLVTGEDAELGWRFNHRGYTLLEEPAIGAIHLGNPKTLAAFYRKQKWHGLGMYGTFRISKFDRPLIMTWLFGGTLAMTLPTTGLLILGGELVLAVLLLAGAVGWAPLATAFYRSGQIGSLRHFPAMVLLYLLFYAARSRALLELLWEEVGRRPLPGKGGA
jgi:glycosyltransferase involved in cell wall biosynthesis